MAKRKRSISPSRLAALRRQARINFGFAKKTTKRGTTSMARRRFSGRVRRAASSGSNILKQVAAGVGMATLSRQFVQPMATPMLGQSASLVNLGAAYYGGGIPGLVGAVLTGQASVPGFLNMGGASTANGSQFQVA